MNKHYRFILKYRVISIKSSCSLFIRNIMTLSEALEKTLPSYERYYTITKEGLSEPFSAAAEFHSHTEKYILVKAAKLDEIDSNEYVYFSLQEKLDYFLLSEISGMAWQEGLKKVKPYSGHRNSDVSLVIFSNQVSEEVKKSCKKIRYSKNYAFGLYGYSVFKLAVVDLAEKKVFTNFQGRDAKQLFNKIGLLS